MADRPDAGDMDLLADEFLQLNINDAEAPQVLEARIRRGRQTAIVIDFLVDRYMGGAQFTIADVVAGMGPDGQDYATVRRAIQELMEDQLVKKAGQRQSGGRGRPSDTYEYPNPAKQL